MASFDFKRMQVQGRMALDQASYPHRKLIMIHSGVTIGVGLVLSVLSYLLNMGIAQTGGLGGMGYDHQNAPVPAGLHARYGRSRRKIRRGVVHLRRTLEKRRTSASSPVPAERRRARSVRSGGIPPRRMVTETEFIEKYTTDHRRNRRKRKVYEKRI